MAIEILSKPKILMRKQNSVLLNWENVFNNNNSIRYTYRLQIFDALLHWYTIYWGRKTQFNVVNLVACMCYSLRLKIITENEESEWLEFKAATKDEPFFLMHMTRAVKFGKTSLLRKLVNKRPLLLELENKECKTPLIQASEKGDLVIATFLVNSGANVNTATLGTKRTPLMVSIYHGHLSIASMLLDKGAKIHLTDINGLSALHYAVDSNCLESVQFALERNFEINLKDNKGWNPLLRAVVMNCNDEIIEAILLKGADADVKDHNGFDFKKHCKLSSKDFNRFVRIQSKENA